jgi:Tol biopolymer transport system component
MATVQVKTTQSLYLVPGAGSQAAVISPLLPQGEYVSGFGWDRNGSLLISEGGRMLRMGVDGNNSSQILGDSASQILDPSVCGTRYVVFSWRFHGGASGRNIWRANVDGSGPTKVTDMSAQAPVCSTDEKWLYYINVSADQVWRVPLDGSGKAEVVPRSVVPKTFLASTQIGLSPDGKFLAFVVGTALNPEVMTAEDKIVLVSLDSATAPRLLNADPRLAGGGFQFTPDGKALAYPIRENGVDNIWLQPLDGSAGRKITNFNSEQIGDLHWSLDGKNLGILRTHSDSDVVLLQESKR